MCNHLKKEIYMNFGQNYKTWAEIIGCDRNYVTNMIFSTKKFKSPEYIVKMKSRLCDGVTNYNNINHVISVMITTVIRSNFLLIKLIYPFWKYCLNLSRIFF